MRALSIAAASIIALGAGIGAASAQVVSRSISEEPVETTVTQTPDGAIITRRPLGERTYIETEPDTVDTVTTREVVRRMDTRPVRMETRPAQTRTTTTRRTVARPAERVVRAERQMVRPAARVVLTPTERQVVYRTIVEREVVPAAPRVIAPAPNYYSTAPVVAADDDYDDGYVTTQPLYRVGARLPANVPLYAVPNEVGYRVPAAQPYSYAYVGGRAYLVDPATSIIVEDVTQ